MIKRHRTKTRASTPWQSDILYRELMMCPKETKTVWVFLLAVGSRIANPS